jgi:hypothetical protein
MHGLSSNFIQVVCNVEYMLKKASFWIGALYKKERTPKSSYAVIPTFPLNNSSTSWFPCSIHQPWPTST